MSIFGRRSGLAATALIGAAIFGAIGAAFLLDAFLPGSSRARNIFSVIQSFVTIIALVTAGIWAYFRFRVFRTLQPHLYIEHRSTHRSLSSSYIHIEVTAILHNTSRVEIELERGVAIVQEVGPISDGEAESLNEEALKDEADPGILWPIIGRLQRDWDGVNLTIEPGSTHSETFEFIVPKWDDQTLLLYTYFYNAEAQYVRGGWSATTVYDVVDRIGRSRAEEATIW